MALKIENGFRKFVRGSPSQFVRAYLQHLASFGNARGLESVLWQQSREALQKPETGYLSTRQYLDLCDELLLGVNTPPTNSMRVTWILQKGDIQENWWLRLVLSEIPHFQGDLLESTVEPVNHLDDWMKAQRQGLFENEVADIVFTPKELYGAAHWLYLDAKISEFKELSKRLREATWAGENPVQALAEASEKVLSRIHSGPITVLCKKVDAFVKASDESLLESLGAQRLSELVKPTNLSLREWLGDTRCQT